MRIAGTKCLARCFQHARRFCATAVKLPVVSSTQEDQSNVNQEKNAIVPRQLVPLLQERDQLLYLGCTEHQQADWLNQLVERLIQDKENGPKNKLGLLILTSSKLQSAEVYSKLMAANTDRKLKISRLGSVSYLAPVITPQGQHVKKRHAELKGTSVENLKQIAESDNLDVLVATIWETSILSPWSKVFKPSYVVLQDFELLFDENHRLLDRALYCMDPETKRIWTSRNNQPRISLQMSHWLPQPNETDPAPVPIIYQNQKERTQILGKQSPFNKVMDIIKFNSNQRGVVFCKNASEALELTDLLIKGNVRAFPLTSGTQPHPNPWSLYNFENKKSSVLVCEERVLRPVQMKEADYAIWLHPPTDAQEVYYRRRSITASARIYRIEAF